MQTQNLKGLGFISNVLHWIDEFVVMISGPVLAFGIGIGLVDLLTNGALSLQDPIFLYIYAIAMAVGVEGQLNGMFYRLARAWRAKEKDWKAIIGSLVFGIGLGYICFVSAEVFAYQQAYHISVAEALNRLGMDTVTWIWQRVAASVILVASSAFLRFTPKVIDERSQEEKKLAMIEEAELTALKQQLQGQNIAGGFSVMRAAVTAVRGKPLPTISTQAALPAPTSTLQLASFAGASQVIPDEDRQPDENRQPAEFYMNTAPTTGRAAAHMAPIPPEAPGRPELTAFMERTVPDVAQGNATASVPTTKVKPRKTRVAVEA